MNDLKLRPATRVGVKPLVALYSESGAGKTYSSLLLARGFVGPAGRIAMIDTESGRGSLYADVLPGGYDVLELREPFAPGRYIEAVQAVEASGAQIGIIDSASHEWEGLGGVLDMAVSEEDRGMKGLGVWKKPKMEHAKFMLKLLQSPVPWIICLRAKHKSRQVKNDRGKTEIVKDDFTSPIQADDFIFEATVHGELLADHSLRITKCSHPALAPCFPAQGPITTEHGKLLAAWCNVGPAPGKPAATTAADPKTALLGELRDLTTKVHGWTKGDGGAAWADAKSHLQQWLWDECVMGPDENLSDATVEQLQFIIGKAKEKLA